MKYCYIKIGYPIGYVEHEDGVIFKIETRTGKPGLDKNAFDAWYGIKNLEISEDVSAEAVRFLKTNNLIFEEDTLPAMFSRIFELVPFRQGRGDIKNNKFAIVLGSDTYYPDKLQMDIWRHADGRNTMLDILRRVAKEHGITATADKINFMKKLDGLLSCGLIYLK